MSNVEDSSFSSAAVLAELKSRIPPFLTKLYTIVDDASFDEFALWSEDGASFRIVGDKEVAKKVLPLFFKHAKIASLHRQLNLYNFCKVGAPEEMRFTHADFVRDKPERLLRIKRNRKSRNNVAASKADAVERELGSLKRKRDAMESELTELMDAHNNLQARLDAAEKEANAMRAELAATRQTTSAMQNTVDTLIAYVYASTGGAPHLPMPPRHTQQQQQQQQQHAQSQSLDVVPAAVPAAAPRTTADGSPLSVLVPSRDPPPVVAPPVVASGMEPLSVDANPLDDVMAMLISPRVAAILAKVNVAPPSEAQFSAGGRVSKRQRKLDDDAFDVDAFLADAAVAATPDVSTSTNTRASFPDLGNSAIVPDLNS